MCFTFRTDGRILLVVYCYHQQQSQNLKGGSKCQGDASSISSSNAPRQDSSAATSTSMSHHLFSVSILLHSRRFRSEWLPVNRSIKKGYICLGRNGSIIECYFGPLTLVKTKLRWCLV